jgi:O-antigen biosynthesis protein
LMSASVIICAYTLERWDALCEAVDSCRRQTRPPLEVIVVIDYNSELEERSRVEFPDVRVVANHLTKGLSGARNTGVLASVGEVVVFLDDDAYAEETWLEHLTDPFTDPLVAGAGGWIVPHWEGPEPGWFPRTFYWVLGCSYDGLPPSGSSIRNPIGASMALRRSVFAEVGGFTDGIGRVGKVPLGCEETEICIRYGQRHGGDRIVLVRDAVVHHRVPAARCTWGYFSSRCWAEGISKAAVSSLVGSGDGLAAERAHVARALPRELLETVVLALRGRPGALGRAVHIVAGSALAVAGLARGTVEFRRHPLRAAVAMPLTTDGDEVATTPSVVTSSAPWRPLEFHRLDIESFVRGRDVVMTPDTSAAWVEVLRGGHVVGRKVVATPGAVLASHDLEELAEHYRDTPVPGELDVDDAQLPGVSVVMPTVCHDPEELVEAVSRLTSLDYPNYEIVVVDNRTDPHAPELPALPGGDRVRAVREMVPGVSSARNRGIAASTAPILVFTDDDVMVEPGWLRAIGARFVAQPGLDALGGLILPAALRTRAQLWFEEYFGGFSRTYLPRTANLERHEDDQMFPFAPGRYAAGANMAFRRESLERVGGFPRDLGTGTPALGGEDLAVFLELAASGATIGFEPRAIVRHHHRVDEDEFRAQVFGYGAGLTAMYARFVVHHPRELTGMLARLGVGVRQLRESRTTRSPTEESSFPPNLKLVEMAGLAYGPIAYFRSWYRFRRM